MCTFYPENYLKKKKNLIVYHFCAHLLSFIRKIIKKSKKIFLSIYHFWIFWIQFMHPDIKIEKIILFTIFEWCPNCFRMEPRFLPAVAPSSTCWAPDPGSGTGAPSSAWSCPGGGWPSWKSAVSSCWTEKMKFFLQIVYFITIRSLLPKIYTEGKENFQKTC